MKILSCGAGMQSTALALMSCENKQKGIVHPLVPVYDAIIFCDLGLEPEWVKRQAGFIQMACEKAGIPFYILTSPLYEDYLKGFGSKRVTSIPFWTVGEDGKKGKMLRNCTLDYKINLIERFVRYELLGYRPHQRLREVDIKAHEMHIGFSKEEERRCRENPGRLFINRFPLVEMGVTRADNYRYILETWGLDTKASACCFCPFHTNYFFGYIKGHLPEDYKKTVMFDEMLEKRQPDTKIKSRLYISRSRKRIAELRPEECCDMQYFPYKGKEIWNGF